MSSFWGDAIELVEEEYAWSSGLCSFEEISNTFLASTDVFVQDLGSFDTDEVETAFASHSAGKKGLPAAGVAIEKQPRTETQRTLRKYGSIRGGVLKSFEQDASCRVEPTDGIEGCG